MWRRDKECPPRESWDPATTLWAVRGMRGGHWTSHDTGYNTVGFGAFKPFIVLHVLERMARQGLKCRCIRWQRGSVGQVGSGHLHFASVLH